MCSARLFFPRCITLLTSRDTVTLPNTGSGPITRRGAAPFRGMALVPPYAFLGRLAPYLDRPRRRPPPPRRGGLPARAGVLVLRRAGRPPRRTSCEIVGIFCSLHRLSGPGGPPRPRRHTDRSPPPRGKRAKTPRDVRRGPPDYRKSSPPPLRLRHTRHQRGCPAAHPRRSPGVGLKVKRWRAPIVALCVCRCRRPE